MCVYLDASRRLMLSFIFIRRCIVFFFFFQAEDGIRDLTVTGVQTCALPISAAKPTGTYLRRPRTPAPPRPTTECTLLPLLLLLFRLLLRRVAGRSPAKNPIRSEERRVGEEGRSPWSPYHLKKKKKSTKSGNH